MPAHGVLGLGTGTSTLEISASSSFLDGPLVLLAARRRWLYCGAVTQNLDGLLFHIFLLSLP